MRSIGFAIGAGAPVELMKFRYNKSKKEKVKSKKEKVKSKREKVKSKK
jgi:hypothetical protein